MKRLISILLELGSLWCVAQPNTWNAIADFEGDGRQFAVSFEIGGLLYVGTGTQTTADGFADFWEYDPVDDEWTARADFEGAPRYAAVGFSINGKGYIALGFDGTTAYNDIWEYDPIGNDWTQKASFEGTARAGAVVFVIGNKAYVGTGDDGSGALGDFWEFDPVADDWTQKASLPVARSYAAAFAIGTSGYVSTGSDAESNLLKDTWQYDPSTNQWIQKADLAGAERVTAVGFSLDGRGYVGGGGGNVPIQDYWSYEPVGNEWHQVADFPGGIMFNATAAVVGGKAYVGTGTLIDFPVTYYAYTVKATQTITFGALAGKTVGDPDFGLTGTASSSLAVTYQSSNTSVATISGSTVTIVGGGTTVIKATQAGDNNYLPAPPVEQSLVVAKLNQTITFNALPGKSFGDAAFALTATASSTLAVTYESSNTDVATISGSNVTIVGAGTTTITAKQAGNASYNAAPDETEELVVAKSNQTITFGSLPPKTGGDPAFDLTATSSSGLPVTYQSSNTAVATIAGSTVTIVGAGTTDITPSQAGNANYNPVTGAAQTLTVSKANQTITFESIEPRKVDASPFTLTASASSGLEISFASADPTVATVSGSTVTLVGIGQTFITATQPGNASYYAAPDVTRILKVTGAFVAASGQGEMWSLAQGGSDDLGAIFKTNSTGTAASVVHEFQADPGGANPHNTLMIEANGKLYGTLGQGGDHNCGVLFEFDPATGAYTVKATFTKDVGKGPVGRLALLNGKLYGVTSHGSNTLGSLFEYDMATSALTKRYSFTNAPNQAFTGTNPMAGLVLGPDGKLYGTTNTGQSGSPGHIFSFDPATGTISGRHSFTAATGSYPASELTLVDGKFYSTTTLGGANNVGTVFEFDPAQNTFTKHYDFVSSGFSAGQGSNLTLAGNGKLYGTTFNGNPSYGGVLYEFDPVAKMYTTRVALNSNDAAIGGYNQATLALGADGKLYGTASVINTKGILFQFDPTNGQHQKVYDFTEGSGPAPGLIGATNGKLYGMISGAGFQSPSTLFEFNPIGNVYQSKANFILAPDGLWMTGGMALATNGKLYGAATGGMHGSGIIYEVDPQTSTFTKKLDLPAGEGIGQDRLAATPDGKLYGMVFTTTAGTGIIFEYNPTSNTRTNKYTISSYPQSNLTYLNGKLYGMTTASGAGYGILFVYDIQAGTFATVIDLLPVSTGTGQRRDLVLAPNGKLYGVAGNGGANGAGTIFELDPLNNAFTKKHDFSTATGKSPAGLTLAPNGKFYGTTLSGGTNDRGTIYEFDPLTGVVTKKYDFALATGYSPYITLTVSSNGKMYGVAQSSGPAGFATMLFEFDPSTGEYKVVKEFPYDSFGNSIRPSESLVFINSQVKDQSLTFELPATKEYVPNFNLTATSTSGLPVVFTSDNTAIATVIGSTVTLLNTGIVNITATQPGNAEYSAAPEIRRTMTVTKAPQTITFEELPPRTVGGAKFTITATASSGLPVTLSVTSGTVPRVNLAGNEATIVSAGVASVTAAQPGNSLYNAATSVVRTFCVNPAKPVITMSGTGGETITLSSSGTGNQWYRNSTVIAGQTAATLNVTEGGSYQVTSSSEGCLSELSNAFAVIVTGTTLTDTEFSLRIYPNPVRTDLLVTWPAGGSRAGEREVMVYDILGRKVDSKVMDEDEISVDVRSLQPGTYVLRATRGSQAAQRRFIKD